MTRPKNRRLRSVNLGKLERQIMHILKMEIQRIEETSANDKLTHTDHTKLCAYAKLVRDLKKKTPLRPEGPPEPQTDVFDDLSEDELKEIMRKQRK